MYWAVLKRLRPRTQCCRLRAMRAIARLRFSSMSSPRREPHERFSWTIGQIACALAVGVPPSMGMAELPHVQRFRCVALGLALP
jgi:hypothetical protein